MKGRTRPSLIQRKFWLTRRAHYIAVFEQALLLLCQREELPVDEPSIVRELRFTTVTARRQLDPEGRFGSPFFEGQNLPDPESDHIEGFEHKRPDIQWVHDDESAIDDRHREKSFVIECKRLGSTTPSGWNLNEQYVICGVARFCSPEWKYGLNMHEGMMIGFVQDMEMPAVLRVVNTHLASHTLPVIKLEKAFAVDGVSALGHLFERSFPKTPFTLIHRWLDIRTVPQAKHQLIKNPKKAAKQRKRSSPKGGRK